MSKIIEHARALARDALFETDYFRRKRSRLFGGAVFGGADRDRTDDLKLAKLALSQLSYGPSAG